jgi:hypothetical protein
MAGMGMWHRRGVWRGVSGVWRRRSQRQHRGISQRVMWHVAILACNGDVGMCGVNAMWRYWQAWQAWALAWHVA